MLICIASRCGAIISTLRKYLIFGSEAPHQCKGQATGMRELGIICVLLAAMANVAGCESSWSKDPQFQKQLKRAQECRQFQDKLGHASGAGREEITNAM